MPKANDTLPGVLLLPGGTGREAAGSQRAVGIPPQRGSPDPVQHRWSLERSWSSPWSRLTCVRDGT